MKVTFFYIKAHYGLLIDLSVFSAAINVDIGSNLLEIVLLKCITIHLKYIITSI